MPYEEPPRFIGVFGREKIGWGAPLVPSAMDRVDSPSDGPSARLVAPGRERVSTLTGVKYWR